MLQKPARFHEGMTHSYCSALTCVVNSCTRLCMYCLYHSEISRCSSSSRVLCGNRPPQHITQGVTKENINTPGNVSRLLFKSIYAKGLVG
eukprot:m.166926 g.166926  ORF g.166926 m.166926 type:complete len:90 (-) comp18175_c0_seq4:1740-2009(-)